MSMEYYEPPLPPDAKLCFFFRTISPSQGGYIICEVSLPDLYKSALFFHLFLK